MTPISQTSQTSHSPRTPFRQPSPDPANDLFFTSTANVDDSPLESSPIQTRRAAADGALGKDDGHTTEPIPSPSMSTAPGFQQRMDTMSRGPFEAYRRPSVAGGTRKGSPPSHLGEPFRAHERPGTSSSNLSTGSGDSIGPPKVPRKNGYEGFGPPLRGNDDLQPPALGMSRSQTFPKPSYAMDPPSLGTISRSETFPRPSTAAESPERTVSALGTKSDRSTQNRNFGDPRRPSMGPDTSRKPPPRTSLIPPARIHQGSVDLTAEFGVGNPYHTPSASGSSGYSGFSQGSQPSSQTSPARSQIRRQPSNSSMSVEKSRLQDFRAPPRSHPRRQDSLPHSPPHNVPSPSSYGRTPPSPYYSGSPKREQRPGLTAHGSSYDLRAGASPPSRPGSRDPGSRGDCKACSHPITGKSISSADGRLTGKYHKPCFVCATCSEPFTSAEFYVHGDKPYCEQHYHRLNGSLCGRCGRGIEGHYVEDETSVKYHAVCFCCLDCGRSLSDGYFEVDGKSYCEQDAWNRTQPVVSPAFISGGGYPPHVDPQIYQQPPPRRGPGPPRSPNDPRGFPGRSGPVPPPGPAQRPRGPGQGMSMPRSPYGPGSGPGPRPGPNGMRPGQGRPPPRGPPPSQRPMMNKRATRAGMMGPA